ncbi:hypothetical protein [Polaribacter sp. Hel1_85]|uniref:hypothetical protein n=1 Tax=Polaribacter sp. Hel1_85 TaxID=1250005 RepID=UPI00052E4290|nr:hypothetical protein [Polaribacter sp. Hel1_85]KGL58677.1 hypothetical protein PHEL85_2943 [Polaribacter sp. Hel1_85]
MIFTDPNIIPIRNNIPDKPSIGKPGGGGGGTGGGTICPNPKAGSKKIIKIAMIFLITIYYLTFIRLLFFLKVTTNK